MTVRDRNTPIALVFIVLVLIAIVAVCGFLGLIKYLISNVAGW